MSQSYNSGPTLNANATSAELRQNFDSLLTSNAGVIIPAYAKEGTLWYDTNSKQQHVAKPYGSMPYGNYLLGPGLNLSLALLAEGFGAWDGSTIDASVKVVRNAYAGGVDLTTTFTPYSPAVGGGLAVWLNNTVTPSQFAGRHWIDTIIGEPILWSADYWLGNKAFDTIPTGDDFIEYAGGNLSNIMPFDPTTLRAVNIEKKTVSLSFSVPPATLIDHMVWNLPGFMEWWENQDGKVRFNFYKNGIRQPATNFKAAIFAWGGSAAAIVYNIDPISQTTTPFPTTVVELEIIKEI